MSQLPGDCTALHVVAWRTKTAVLSATPTHQPPPLLLLLPLLTFCRRIAVSDSRGDVTWGRWTFWCGHFVCVCVFEFWPLTEPSFLQWWRMYSKYFGQLVFGVWNNELFCSQPFNCCGGQKRERSNPIWFLRRNLFTCWQFIDCILWTDPNLKYNNARHNKNYTQMNIYLCVAACVHPGMRMARPQWTYLMSDCKLRKLRATVISVVNWIRSSKRHSDTNRM